MAKRLVVLCDGTWNRPDQVDHGVATPTNVSKLHAAVAGSDPAGTVQLAHYQAGVGTRPLEHWIGGAFGYGVSRNIREAYRFLVERYEPGDELWLFGFSRGAFTARSTAGLVRNCGILRDRRLDLIGDAFRLYRDRGDDTAPDSPRAEAFRRAHSHPDSRIRFVGVWDTVGSLGIPIGGLRLPLLTRLWGFHDTRLSSRVDAGYQALAIDERRRPFKPTLWERQEHAAGQVLEQVWFAGVHSDVGGGYRDAALSALALLWMAAKASAAGLALDAGAFDGLRPDPLGELHDSLRFPYSLLGPSLRTLEGDGAALASSAVTRRRESSYDPPNLSAFKGPTTQVP